jgi:hemin uptake protein HemP
MSEDKTLDDKPGSLATAGGPTPPRKVSSEELLKGNRELWIEHEGELYRLRLTSRGKLYLTK